MYSLLGQKQNKLGEKVLNKHFINNNKSWKTQVLLGCFWKNPLESTIDLLRFFCDFSFWWTFNVGLSRVSLSVRIQQVMCRLVYLNVNLICEIRSPSIQIAIFKLEYNLFCKYQTRTIRRPWRLQSRRA